MVTISGVSHPCVTYVVGDNTKNKPEWDGLRCKYANVNLVH